MLFTNDRQSYAIMGVFHQMVSRNFMLYMLWTHITIEIINQIANSNNQRYRLIHLSECPTLIGLVIKASAREYYTTIRKVKVERQERVMLWVLFPPD